MRIFAKIVILLAAMIFVFPTPSEAQIKRSHWRYPIVYVENHAPEWPIREAAENLDNGSGLKLIVVKKCRADVQCIKVRSIRKIRGPAVGLAQRTSRYGKTIRAKVLLENEWGDVTTDNQKLTTVCHELGHAVGLPHNDKTYTCMNSGVGEETSTTLGESDRHKLDRWY